MDLEIDFYRKWACQRIIESSHSNVWEGHWACAAIALTNLLDDKLVPSAVTETELNPLEPSYWKQALAESRHGHYFKYAYSYLRLCRMSGRSPSDFRSFQRIL